MILIFSVLIQIFQQFFLTVNNELHKIGELFKKKRLSLNIKKTSIHFFARIQLKVL